MPRKPNYPGKPRPKEIKRGVRLPIDFYNGLRLKLAAEIDELEERTLQSTNIENVLTWKEEIQLKKRKMQELESLLRE